MATTVHKEDLVKMLSYLNGLLEVHDGSQLQSSQIWKPLEDGQEIIGTGIAEGMESFRVHRRLLQELIGIARLLSGLANSVTDEANQYQSALDAAARQEGMNNLPDELLSFIMELSVDNFKDACALSCVCTRMRSLMLSSPKAWANAELSPARTAEQLSVVLARSGDMPLRAHVSISEDAAVVDRFRGFSSRVQDLKLTCKRAIFDIKDIYLPQLRTLEVISEEYSGIVQHCYATWPMPLLEDLSCVDHIPGPRVTMWNSLLYCKIQLNNKYGRFDGDQLLECLRSAGSLITLKVAAVQVLGFRGEPPNVPAVIVPNLMSMVIDVQGQGLRHLGLFLDRLILGQLSVLELKMDVDFGSKPRTIAECETNQNIGNELIGLDLVLNFISRHRQLRTISLSVSTKYSFRKQMLAALLFQRFDNLLIDLPSSLETFDVTTPLYQIQIRRDGGRNIGAMSASRINFLRVGHGKWLTVDFLRMLKTSVVQGDADPRIIEVENCPLIKDEDIRAVFTNSSVNVC